MFLPNLAVNKNKKSKGKFADNQFYNILTLFDILPNFPSTTFQIMCDYYL